MGVVTRGLEPPMAPGRMEPVSWYRARILETQPCDTRSCRLMSHGLHTYIIHVILRGGTLSLAIVCVRCTKGRFLDVHMANVKLFLRKKLHLDKL